MLRPLVRRVFSSRLMTKTRDVTIEFERKMPGKYGSRMMCTVQRANDEVNSASKSDQTETSEGEETELDQKIKLLEEKDGVINDLQVVIVYLKFGACPSQNIPFYSFFAINNSCTKLGGNIVWFIFLVVLIVTKFTYAHTSSRTHAQVHT